MISEHEKNLFLEAVWGFYRTYGRHGLLWRQPEPDGSFNPYKIMVSEIMLQQTQVSRVASKYVEFLDRFADIPALASSDLGDVLRTWQGLGYNRRAKYLWQTAQIVEEHGRFPTDLEGLVRLPGIGKNTAGAILAYVFNKPVVFIETNIRTVYIHHFCSESLTVNDKEIRALLESTLDIENPRDFYWALMDYGSHLKATVGNPNKASKHYSKQPAFNGSRRQVRGLVLRLLAAGPQTLAEIKRVVPDERLEGVLTDLSSEGMIQSAHDTYSL